MKKVTNAVMLAATISLLFLSGCGSTDTSYNKYPDIVLILIDTIRADHLSVNGYYRETTPVLDSLASTGTIFTRVQGQSSWTLPAMASVLTGLSQRSHGAGNTNGILCGIDPAFPTITHFIKHEAGYQTAAFFNVIFMNENFGFQQSFDYFDCHSFETTPRNAEETVSDYLEWYDASRDSTKPLFSAIHFSDPHLPYDAPQPWDTLYSNPKADGIFNKFWGSENDILELNSGHVEIDSTSLAIMIGLYDAELSFTDSQIGRLITELSSRNATVNTVFIIVGGNGEEFLEHGGMGHGYTLYQEILNVPLIISGRNIPIAVNNRLTAQTDIMPIILGMLGLDIPVWVEGSDILNTDPGQRYIPSSGVLSEAPDIAAVRLEDRIVIGNTQEADPILYNLRNDPHELNPLLPSRETVNQLYYYWSLPPKGQPPVVTFAVKTRRKLEALGYLG